MRAHVAAARIANAKFLNQSGIVHPALSQILNAFRIAVQVHLIKSGGVLEELRAGRQFLLQVGEALTKGEMLGKLHEANQVASQSAGVAVEQILAAVDAEGRASVLMQGAEPDEFVASSGGAPAPVVPLQVLEQRNALFEPFQILTHGGYRPSSVRVRTSGTRSQARMVGEKRKISVSKAQGPRPEDSQKAKHGGPR